MAKSSLSKIVEVKEKTTICEKCVNYIFIRKKTFTKTIYCGIIN